MIRQFQKGAIEKISTTNDKLHEGFEEASNLQII